MGPCGFSLLLVIGSAWFATTLLNIGSKILKTHTQTHPAVIYISKALVLKNYLTTCCIAGDSENETERAKTLNSRSKRKTPTNLKAMVTAPRPP